MFTAVFTAHEKAGTVAESYRGSFLLRIILIGLGGILLLVGGILCIVRRKQLGAFLRRKKGCGAVQSEEAFADVTEQSVQGDRVIQDEDNAGGEEHSSDSTVD